MKKALNLLFESRALRGGAQFFVIGKQKHYGGARLWYHDIVNQNERASRLTIDKINHRSNGNCDVAGHPLKGTVARKKYSPYPF